MFLEVQIAKYTDTQIMLQW